MDPEPTTATGALATAAAALALIGFRVEVSRNQILRELKPVWSKLQEVFSQVDETLDMHRHPEDSEFGTKETNARLNRIHVRMDEQEKGSRELNDLIRDNTRAQRELTAVIRHSLAQTGHPVPIVLPGDG